MSITEHLLVNKVISIDGFVENEVSMKLYYEMTDSAVFGSSMVSDTRGGLEQTHDTDYRDIVHNGRISETAFHHSFSELSLNLLNGLTRQVAELLNVEINRFEPWQCTRYWTGGLFDYHDDCGNWASNERLYTVLLTVRAPDFGGATHFPKLNMMVESKSARLLIWRNLNEDYLCDGQSMHCGMPVGQLGKEDEKMILVTWIRRFEYVP